ncbi:hypothetical protein ACU5B6_20180 [Moritella viscosa]|uniref:hypothetical protein n=1 Tax=Moritella viscosa TaxID=80854 RepID=UPI000920301C|nr:hypothetical protein [Moritella viscosa]SHO08910.1 Methylmalonate semialdehyde dehydrogenase [acylating] 2-Malonate semialdehyde dehydrogenase [acetylating] 2 [Moritella viscosa]
MSTSDKYSFTSLRSVDYQADKDFYTQLSEKTLMTIARFSRESKELTLSSLKSHMGINFRVLTKMVEELTSQELIKVYIKAGVSKEQYQAHDVLISLTQSGKVKATSMFFSSQGIGE